MLEASTLLTIFLALLVHLLDLLRKDRHQPRICSVLALLHHLGVEALFAALAKRRGLPSGHLGLRDQEARGRVLFVE